VDAPSLSLEFERPPMSKTRQGARATVRGTAQKAVELPAHKGRLAHNADASQPSLAAVELERFARGRRFATILADPPWQFTNKTGKVAPEHKRLSRYGTMKLEDIMALPLEQLALPTSHLYLWCPNAMLPEGLAVMKA
jgi:hypothetical protein